MIFYIEYALQILAENQIEVNPTHVEELRDLIALNIQNAFFASLVHVKQNTFVEWSVMNYWGLHHNRGRHPLV